MKRTFFFTFFLIIVLSVLTAEDTEQPKQPESVATYEAIHKGDQYINLMVGASFPLFNIAPDGIHTTTNMKIGGNFVMGYSRFLTSRLALGGGIDLDFNSTLGENIYFCIPFLFKPTYVFVIKNIHIPVTMSVGGVLHTYNSSVYFGPVVQPSFGVFYQYSPEWSFGINTAWSLLPQWYADSADDRAGNILSVTAGIRYHF